GAGRARTHSPRGRIGPVTGSQALGLLAEYTRPARPGEGPAGGKGKGPRVVRGPWGAPGGGVRGGGRGGAAAGRGGAGAAGAAAGPAGLELQLERVTGQLLPGLLLVVLEHLDRLLGGVLADGAGLGEGLLELGPVHPDVLEEVLDVLLGVVAELLD